MQHIKQVWNGFPVSTLVSDRGIEEDDARLRLAKKILEAFAGENSTYLIAYTYMDYGANIGWSTILHKNCLSWDSDGYQMLSPRLYERLCEGTLHEFLMAAEELVKMAQDMNRRDKASEADRKAREASK